MKACEIKIVNATVLTLDAQNSILKDAALCLQGDTIVYMGDPKHGPDRAVKRIDAKGGLVLPGLINGHTHAAMTLFRGLADDLPLMDWLNHYIFPVESRMDGEFVRTGTALACAEMILSGTTTFCDMYLFEDEVAEAAYGAGMRAVVGEVLYDFPSPNYGPWQKGLEYTERLIQKWEANPLISVAVEPHSLFTCSPELLEAAHRLAADYHVPLIIHVAETIHEIDQIRKRYGRSPIEHLEALGLLGPHLIADHCVHLRSQELEKIAEAAVKVVHNPESNMKLASGIAPVPEMLKLGITVGLGTDGCASNNDLDLFSEMDMAAKLHKIHTMDTTVMDAATVLRMATMEGAKALGMEDLVGSLEVGKKADIIVVDTDRPHLTPMYNPYSHLVYAARGDDVTHTIINGRLVMEDRKLLTIDLEDLMARTAEAAAKVKAWVG